MIYKVWADSETEEDAIEVTAFCEGMAAQYWAKLRDEDSGVYEIADGHPIKVWVLNTVSYRMTKHIVFGQFTPTYTSYLAKDE